MHRLVTDGPIYYQFDQWRHTPSLVHGVFTRLGGTSAAPWASLNVGSLVGDDPQAVERNAALIYQALGVDGERACTVWQVHGCDAVVARERLPDRRWLAQADAIVTNQPGLPINLRFADCVPVLFYDPVHQAIGMAHAGWRGTVAGVVRSTLETMQTAFGTQAADVQAAIGPSIGPECYQVGQEVVDAVQAAFGGTEKLVRRAQDGSTYLDLWAANRLALERMGVRQIEISGICTATHTDEFFSHRAEHGKTGRFAAVMALAEHPI